MSTLNYIYYNVLLRSLATYLLFLLCSALPPAHAETTPLDLNNDGRIDMLDLVVVHDEFGRYNCSTQPGRSDVNHDGRVDDHDKSIIIAAIQAARTAAPSTDTQRSVKPGDDNRNSISADGSPPGLEISKNCRYLLVQNIDNATVLDTRTNLIWTRDANPAGVTLLFHEALAYIKDMNSSKHPNFGYYDWRLPSFQDLYSLLDFTTIDGTQHNLPAGHPFRNVAQSQSRKLTDTYLSNAVSPLLFSCYCRLVGHNAKLCFGYVWPVRDSRQEP